MSCGIFLSLSAWFYLILIISRFIHVVESDIIIFCGWVIFTLYIYISSLSIHLLMDTSAIVNNAIMNSIVQISLWESAFIFLYPEVGLPNHMVVLLIFWRTSILFAMVEVPVYIPTNNVRSLPFSTSLQTLIIFIFLIIAIFTVVKWYISLWLWFAFPEE